MTFCSAIEAGFFVARSCPSVSGPLRSADKSLDGQRIASPDESGRPQTKRHHTADQRLIPETWTN